MSACLLAEFSDPERLLAVARQTRQASTYKVVDAYSPFPVEGLAAQLDDGRPTRVRLALGIGGLSGAVIGLLLQWASATQLLPLMAGGRALASWPEFFFAVFELGVLGAALAGFGALLVGCGLPRLNHPLFDVPGFERASQDRFFLAVDPGEAGQIPGARAWLQAAGALSVREVPR